MGDSNAFTGHAHPKSKKSMTLTDLGDSRVEREGAVRRDAMCFLSKRLFDLDRQPCFATTVCSDEQE